MKHPVIIEVPCRIYLSVECKKNATRKDLDKAVYNKMTKMTMTQLMSSAYPQIETFLKSLEAPR